MAQDLLDSELQAAQERRLYWQCEYESAIEAGDYERAATAARHLRRYQWLIGLLAADGDVVCGRHCEHP